MGLIIDGAYDVESQIERVAPRRRKLRVFFRDRNPDAATGVGDVFGALVVFGALF